MNNDPDRLRERRWLNWTSEGWVRELQGRYPLAAFLALLGAPMTVVGTCALALELLGDRIGYFWWGRVYMLLLSFSSALLIAVGAIVSGSHDRLRFSEGMRRFAMAFGYLLILWAVLTACAWALGIASTPPRPR